MDGDRGIPGKGQFLLVPSGYRSRKTGPRDAEDVDAYGDEEPKLSMDYAPRKIRLPEHMEEAGRLVIMKHQIDTNHHVNNAQYVDMAVEALPEEADGREITEIRAEYKKAAVLGDTAVLMRAAGEDGYVVSSAAETEASLPMWN